MATYTFEQLQGMQRRDLQALAKKYDVRANGKTTEIIADLLAAFEKGDGAAPQSPMESASLKSKSTAARSRSASPAPKASPSPSKTDSPKSKSVRSGSPSSKAAATKSASRSPVPRSTSKSRSRSPSPAKSPKKIPEGLAQEIKEASANRSPIPTLPKPTEEMKSIHKELKRKAEELSPIGSPKKARTDIDA